MRHSQLIIIGSGPSGYTAGIYAARANLKPLLIQGSNPGGQLMTTTDVENWPGGKEGLLGPELMASLQEHASRMGVEIIQEHITKVNLLQRPFVLHSGEMEYQCEALIIATGASAKYLGLPSEQKYLGKGVSACATCDGFFYRNKVVAVVGGGNVAVEEALYLSKIAKLVYLIHRRDSLRAEAVLQQRIQNCFQQGTIVPCWNYAVKEITGQDFVTGVELQSTNSTTSKNLAIDGLFIAIGHTPNTALFQGQLDMDNGYISVGHNHQALTQTSVDGVFAAGDVTDHIYRQAITSAGSGCMAALDAVKFFQS
ncbi:MAG: thioredoxin-disulfide reductase [Methylacidiphilales bacterium]|nr:thioredoxin-disulfide reductase [Candidatus Methylacidiphilales bacterium]